MSTHNIRFHGEIRKILCGYPPSPPPPFIWRYDSVCHFVWQWTLLYRLKLVLVLVIHIQEKNQFCYRVTDMFVFISCNIRKCTLEHVRPAKLQISLIRVFIVCMKKYCILSYRKCPKILNTLYHVILA